LREREKEINQMETNEQKKKKKKKKRKMKKRRKKKKKCQTNSIFKPSLRNSFPRLRSVIPIQVSILSGSPVFSGISQHIPEERNERIPPGS